MKNDYSDDPPCPLHVRRGSREDRAGTARGKNLRRGLIGLTASLGAGLVPATASAGAWTLEEGGVLLAFPGEYVFVDEQFDENGSRVDRPNFQMFEFAPYGEVGVTDYLTLGLQPKFRWVSLETPTGTVTNYGLPEVDVFGRVRLWHQDEAAISIQGLTKIPVDPEENSIAALGRDQFDAEIQVMYGNRHKISMGKIFYNVGIGYRHRFGPPSDEISVDGYIGWWTGGRWTFVLSSLNTIGVDPERTGVQVLTETPGVIRLKAQLTASYRLTDSLSVYAGGGTTYWGRNVGASYSGTAGLALRF